MAIKHPLEDEELIITVAVAHVQTAHEASRSVSAGRGINVKDATEKALWIAMDDLLELIEIQGG